MPGSKNVLVCLQFVSLWLQAHTQTAPSVGLLPERRLDTIGAYTLVNSRQCQRLCWYRLLCTSFSFHDNAGQGSNCVLHSSHVEDAPTVDHNPPEWSEHIVQSPSSTANNNNNNNNNINVCSMSRPCAPAEVCVPESNRASRCASLPAHCGDPNPIPDANFAVSSRIQGALAALHCASDFVEIPRNVSMEIECQVNGRWTAVPGECMQAVYRHPTTPLQVPLPWLPWDGWKACLKGVFAGTQRMYLDLLTANKQDSVVHIDFRHDWWPYTETLLVTTSVGGWFPQQPYYLGTSPPMLLQQDDVFHVMLHYDVTGDALLIELLRNDVEQSTWSVPLTGTPRLDLTPARFLSVSSDPTLTYVNLVAGC
ncbi:uncharacterized protein [Littorina saxatilis]|uniref:Apple domain-containing protein n=1 Tax=Littorina saxatilis TaxID=31220 RepID=A0AAN9C435_9CAEN